MAKYYRMAQLTVEWQALFVLQWWMIHWVLNSVRIFLRAHIHSLEPFFCFATCIESTMNVIVFMQIIHIPQAFDKFLVSLCLVVVMCLDFKRSVSSRSNENILLQYIKSSGFKFNETDIKRDCLLIWIL